MSLTASRIVSTDDLRAGVAAIPRTLPAWQGEEGPRLELTIAPGMVRLSRRDRGRAERALQRRLDERGREVEHLTGFGRAGFDVVATRDFLRGMTGKKRENITHFSAKSRARMVRTLCELDYAPLFEQGRSPGMVTLTSPGEAVEHAWKIIFPTAADYKAAVDRFKLMYQRAWGHSIQGVRKTEFQRRGAPHEHILMTAPEGRSRGLGLPFYDAAHPHESWLHVAWAAACGVVKTLVAAGVAREDAERAAEDHLRAGVGLDYSDKLLDAKRIAVYYSKHGLYSAKDYQNTPPVEWLETGSVGRFWGYWGLKKGGQLIEVDTTAPEAPTAAEQVATVRARCESAGIEISDKLLSHIETQIIHAREYGRQRLSHLAPGRSRNTPDPCRLRSANRVSDLGRHHDEASPSRRSPRARADPAPILVRRR